MHEVREAFASTVAAAVNSNGVLVARANGSASLGGFVCSTSGTLVLTDADAAVILASTPVTAGFTVPLPFKCPNGCSYTLGGGASGTFFYG